MHVGYADNRTALMLVLDDMLRGWQVLVGHVDSSAALAYMSDDMLRCCQCMWVMLTLLQHLCLCPTTCWSVGGAIPECVVLAANQSPP